MDSSNVRIHAYQRPDVSLTRLAVHGVLAVPKNKDLIHDIDKYIQKLTQLLNDCQAFHSRIFHGRSELRWWLWGPLTLSKTCEEYDHNFGQNERAFWGPMVQEIETRFLDPSTTPPLLSKSHREHDDSWNPTNVTLTVFAHYGGDTITWETQENGSIFSKQLAKYFLWKNVQQTNVCAIRSLDDIHRAGGSAACFLGRRPFNGIFHLHQRSISHVKDSVPHATTHQDELLPQATQATPNMERRGSDIPVATLPPTPCISAAFEHQVGFGIGIITEEAWMHPEIPGCNSVVYHEGIGHSVNMPHPPRSHPLCVMDTAQYSCTKMEEQHIALEIIEHMISKTSNSPIVYNRNRTISLDNLAQPTPACSGCSEAIDHNETFAVSNSTNSSFAFSVTSSVVPLVEQLLTQHVGDMANHLLEDIRGILIISTSDNVTKEVTVDGKHYEYVPMNKSHQSSSLPNHWIYTDDISGFLVREKRIILVVDTCSSTDDDSTWQVILVPFRALWREIQLGTSTDANDTVTVTSSFLRNSNSITQTSSKSCSKNVKKQLRNMPSEKCSESLRTDTACTNAGHMTNAEHHASNNKSSVATNQENSTYTSDLTSTSKHDHTKDSILDPFVQSFLLPRIYPSLTTTQELEKIAIRRIYLSNPYTFTECISPQAVAVLRCIFLFNYRRSESCNESQKDPDALDALPPLDRLETLLEDHERGLSLRLPSFDSYKAVTTKYVQQAERGGFVRASLVDPTSHHLSNRSQINLININCKCHLNPIRQELQYSTDQDPTNSKKNHVHTSLEQIDSDCDFITTNALKNQSCSFSIACNVCAEQTGRWLHQHPNVTCIMDQCNSSNTNCADLPAIHVSANVLQEIWNDTQSGGWNSFHTGVWLSRA